MEINFKEPVILIMCLTQDELLGILGIHTQNNYTDTCLMFK